MTQDHPATRAGALDPSSAVLALALSLAWLGCAHAHAPAERAAPLPPSPGLPVYPAPESTTGASRGVEPAPEEPRGDISLRDALTAALLHNPDLATFSWEIRVREARALQAGLRPNPELAIEVENFVGSGDFAGADQAETTFALGQLIELGGKRTKRRRLAELDATLAGWSYEVRRVAIFAEVSEAFSGLLAAQEESVLTRETLGLAQESLASVGRQVRAGATSAVERIRAEVTVSAREMDRRNAEAALTNARLRLAALWGSREPLFDRALGDLHEVTAPPPLSRLLARLDQSPERARWLGEVDRREAALALETAKRLPDVTASVGVRRLEETDDSTLLFGLSVPLPFYDRNQGERLAAHGELAQALHLRRSERVRAETALRSNHAELTASFAEVHALRDSTLPQAEAAQRGVREGYLRGLVRHIDVLDAQHTLFELRTRELEALRRYHAARAEIERLTGAPLEPDIDDTRGTQQ